MEGRRSTGRHIKTQHEEAVVVIGQDGGPVGRELRRRKRPSPCDGFSAVFSEGVDDITTLSSGLGVRVFGVGGQELQDEGLIELPGKDVRRRRLGESEEVRLGRTAVTWIWRRSWGRQRTLTRASLGPSPGRANSMVRRSFNGQFPGSSGAGAGPATGGGRASARTVRGSWGRAVASVIAETTVRLSWDSRVFTKSARSATLTRPVFAVSK